MFYPTNSPSAPKLFSFYWVEMINWSRSWTPMAIGNLVRWRSILARCLFRSWKLVLTEAANGRLEGGNKLSENLWNELWIAMEVIWWFVGERGIGRMLTESWKERSVREKNWELYYQIKIKSFKVNKTRFISLDLEYKDERELLLNI